jgi:hypothetical protein
MHNTELRPSIASTVQRELASTRYTSHEVTALRAGEPSGRTYLQKEVPST